jgi:asparagine synthase (glutamine-hydrolysing)
MCGIAGFVDFNNKSSKQDLERMTNTLAHRGPDGQGVEVFQRQNYQIGLGHRRLSIIDLSSAANQPMSYDKLHIVFNGEIYNYNEIRNELLKLGHLFSTHSDTEVILHAWREWGQNCIHQWRGMFAITLFDEKTNELICIRDRAGVKPYYYYFENNTFIFASELKAIMEHHEFKKLINEDALGAFLQYGYIPSPYCIFENTHKLPSGHLLKLMLDTKEIYISQYWNVYDYYNKPKLSIGIEEAISETEKILTTSFQYRMVADVPVGVFLSGGYDSTCVAALLQKDSTEKLKTFTIGTDSDKLNEAPFAKKIALHLGTEHTEYYCTIKEALNIIPQLPYYYDEPFADSSAIPTILVSQMARKKVTVALSADAGDEIFAGYNRYEYVSKYGNKLNAIPSPIKKIAAQVMGSIATKKIPYLKNKTNFHSRYDKIKNLLKNSSPDAFSRNLSLVFNDKELNLFLKNPINIVNTLHSSNELINQKDNLANLMAIDYQTYMVDNILQKVDRATMSVALEGREPFLDQHIIEWAAQLPSNLKFYKGQKKYILKQIVHKYVPKEIMERPKSGFAIPIVDWLKNELKILIEDLLSDSALQHHSFFNLTEVKKLYKDFCNGKEQNYVKIWHLIIFQMWYKKWM